MLEGGDEGKVKFDVLLRSDHNVVLYVRLYLQKCKLGFTLTASGSPSTVMIMGFRFGVLSEVKGYISPFLFGILYRFGFILLL